MDYFFNDQLDVTLARYFQTYNVTVDTMDYVPTKHVTKIHAFVFKNLKRDFKLIRKDVKKHKRELRKAERRELKELARNARKVLREKKREARHARKAAVQSEVLKKDDKTENAIQT